jgi:hypothetical protein
MQLRFKALSLSFQILLFLIYSIIYQAEFILDKDVLYYFVIVQFAFNYLTNYIINKWLYNAYGMFLTLFFIFILSRILLDLLGLDSFPKTSFFSSYVYSDIVVLKILEILLLSLSFLNLGFILNSKNSISLRPQFQSSRLLKAASILFLILGFFPVVFKLISIVLVVFNHGYLVLFTSPELVDQPVIISIFSTFFSIGFILFHLSGGGKGSLVINSIFISLIIFELLVGKRGTVITQLLVLMWFFAVVYRNFFSIKSLVLIAIIIITLSQLVLMFRGGASLLLLQSFLHQQGVSVQVLGYVVDRNISERYVFKSTDVFRPVVQRVDRFTYKITGETYSLNPVERMNKYNNYSMVIANDVDSNKFQLGFGIGGSYLAELYLIWGLWGIVIMNFILGFFLARFEYIACRSRLSLAISVLILPSIIYLPRGYLLNFLNNSFSHLILILFVFGLYYLLKSKSKRREVIENSDVST